MTEQLRQALAALHFNSADGPNDVWGVSPSHVDGLHTRAERRIRTGVLDAKKSSGSSPIGLALQGQKGVGKTHLLGRVRQIVQREGGYFFLAELTTGAAFWEDVTKAMRSELLLKNDDGELQLTDLLRRLCAAAGVTGAVTGAILGDAELGMADLRDFLGAIRRIDAQVAADCSDTIRALVLYASLDSDLVDVGREYLSGLAETTAGGRRAWGIRADPKSHRELVTDISRVLALTGPSVVSIDQLDDVVDRAKTALDEGEVDGELTGDLALIAGGLMQLREVTRRTLTLVACLPNTWKMLHSVATDTVADRFTETPILGAIRDADLGRELVAKWLGVIYEENGFTPPHPTWPVASSAFGDTWIAFTPRQLLRRIQEHAEACVYGRIRELTSFDEEVVVEEPAPTEVAAANADYFAEFDRRFTALRERADVDAALDQHTEDTIMPGLLQAALRAWITEIGNDDRAWETEPATGSDGQLHAGLRRLLDEERDTVERWLFRAIAPQHGIKVLNKVRDAKAAAGVRDGVPNRHLVLLHHGTRGWGGAVTRNEVRELAELGSPRHEISRDDVRTFFALKEMLTNQSFELLNWLVVRKPASQTNFLRQVLPAPSPAQGDDQETRPPPARDGVESRTGATTAPGTTAGAAAEAIARAAAEARVSARPAPGPGSATAPEGTRAAATPETAPGTAVGARAEAEARVETGTRPSTGTGASAESAPGPESTRTAVAPETEAWPAAGTRAGSAPGHEATRTAVAPETSAETGTRPPTRTGTSAGTSAETAPEPESTRATVAPETEAATGTRPSTTTGTSAGSATGPEGTRTAVAPETAAWPAPGSATGPEAATRTAAQPSAGTEGSAIVLGMDGEIRIEVESLRKHAVIFAGSGTGKTVLLRRIVEECALQGVSAIVLDPNNDLARFGDAWPQAPDGWRPGDADRAAEYLANTDVVVWTPGRASGRPLAFHPLPDFTGVRDDPDEFAAAVGAAVASLVPHARVADDTKLAVRGRAVLRETMIHYARTGGRSLTEFIDVLGDLPDGVSKLSTARKMAADLAETLRAAMVNDPLLGGAGAPADPAALLTPAPGKRARISVISFIGLPADEQRQGFVSQLQLEVFAWIKRNPATDRPLGGLFVMDEAQTIAPSGAWTASTQSTILLASQARKYGLGLVLATQAPKGLHNQVTGNATTQFFGRLNSPAQIAAANEMARAKGSTVADISRLERGFFYVTGDTFGFRRMRAPLCLSHHPPGPLRLEEVLDRTR